MYKGYIPTNGHIPFRLRKWPTWVVDIFGREKYLTLAPLLKDVKHLSCMANGHFVSLTMRCIVYHLHRIEIQSLPSNIKYIIDNKKLELLEFLFYEQQNFLDIFIDRMVGYVDIIIYVPGKCIVLHCLHVFYDRFTFKWQFVIFKEKKFRRKWNGPLGSLSRWWHWQKRWKR